MSPFHHKKLLKSTNRKKKSWWKQSKTIVRFTFVRNRPLDSLVSSIKARFGLFFYFDLLILWCVFCFLFRFLYFKWRSYDLYGIYTHLYSLFVFSNIRYILCISFYCMYRHAISTVCCSLCTWHLNSEKPCSNGNLLPLLLPPLPPAVFLPNSSVCLHDFLSPLSVPSQQKR